LELGFESRNARLYRLHFLEKVIALGGAGGLLGVELVKLVVLYFDRVAFAADGFAAGSRFLELFVKIVLESKELVFFDFRVLVDL
jgi:hypothetical protein